MQHLGSHLTDFHEIWYFRFFFSKISQKIQTSFKSDHKNGHSSWRSMCIYDTSLNASRNDVLDKSVEKIKTYFLSITFFSKIMQASACNTGTTQNQPHQIPNTQHTENKTTDVVIQQHSRKLLMMDILMSETCWVHKKWNKIASDIKFVLYSSSITMMHGPINIRF